MNSTRRILIGIGVFVAFVAIATFLNRADLSNRTLVQEVDRSERPVRTVTVQPVRLAETFEQTGVLEANRDVTLTAEVGGKIQAIVKRLGDSCEEGEAAVRLEASNYRIALLDAEAGLTQAQVGFGQAERDLKRTEQLAARAAVPAQDLQRAQSAMASARAVVQRAEAAVAMARRNVAEATVRCPFAGVVAARMVAEGQLVAPHAPLLRLVEIHQLRLMLSVSASQLECLAIGQKVLLADASVSDERFEGTLARLGVAADPTTRTFPVEIAVPGGHAKPGQVVEASVVIAVHEDALAVPKGALLAAQGSPGVLLVVDGKAQRAAVETGAVVGEQVIVTKGLTPGDEVIVVGVETVKPGQAVRSNRPQAVPSNSEDPRESAAAWSVGQGED